MPDIDNAIFAGNESIEAEEWGDVCGPDLSVKRVGTILQDLGWDKKAAAAIGIRLTPDNVTPEAARLILLGDWDQPIKIQARKCSATWIRKTVMRIY